MDRYMDIKKKLLECAEEDSLVKAVIAIGSSTRDEVKADEYSDLDLIIVTERTEEWFSGEYPNRLGEVSISFIESTLGGGKERRCIYDGDRDVDMIIFTPEQFGTALSEGVAAWVMNRGYQILFDRNSYEEMITKYVQHGHAEPDMTEEEFINSVNDFYFHNIWAEKKLRRGEIWSAKMCVDAYLKKHLLKMLELYCSIAEGKDVWHDGRFLDKWAGDKVLSELKECFAHYDREDIEKALIRTHYLYEKTTRKIADIKKFCYPEKAASSAKKYINI